MGERKNGYWMPMFETRLWLLALLVGLTYGAGVAAQSAIAERVTGDAIATGDQAKGVILLAVRWDRRWRCGGFENAQLRVIGFDKLPSTKTDDDVAADIVLDDAPLLMTKPVFDNYVIAKPASLSRLVSRQHARLIAQTGGVVGIWGIATPSASLSDFVDRIARAVDAVGVDHVGLGSDIGGAVHNIWSDYSSFPEIVRLLRLKGFGAADIGKIAGGNYVRVFNASLTR